MLEILHCSDPALREKARPVTSFGAELILLVEAMREVMRENRGVGLAATQLGVNLQICLCRPRENEPEFLLINPVILETSQEVEEAEEGCLSLPGVFAYISRSRRIKIHYRNIRGKRHILEVHGYLARIIQHEYDHLQGRLFVDHIADPLLREKIEKKMRIFNKLS